MRHPAVLRRQFFTPLSLQCERERPGICNAARKLRSGFVSRIVYTFYQLVPFFFVEPNGKNIARRTKGGKGVSLNLQRGSRTSLLVDTRTYNGLLFYRRAGTDSPPWRNFTAGEIYGRDNDRGPGRDDLAFGEKSLRISRAAPLKRDAYRALIIYGGIVFNCTRRAIHSRGRPPIPAASRDNTSRGQTATRI